MPERIGAALAETQPFRDAMASVCCPVTVVTAIEGARPHGTTVSAFSSLSLDPPLVLVALDRGSDLLAIVRRTRRFGVNLLAHGHDALALRFARKGAEKFDGVPWTEQDGLPRLAGDAGWLACEVENLLPGGDHVIVIGRVLASEPIAGAPLAYQNRRFGTHSEFAALEGGR